jgi:hypothetical protein
MISMKIFNSEDFLSLSPANLFDILQLDSLCISEVNVFRSVLKWAESKLSQSKKLITGESRRRIMLECKILYIKSSELKIFIAFCAINSNATFFRLVIEKSFA